MQKQFHLCVKKVKGKILGTSTVEGTQTHSDSKTAHIKRANGKTISSFFPDRPYFLNKRKEKKSGPNKIPKEKGTPAELPTPSARGGNCQLQRSYKSKGQRSSRKNHKGVRRG